MGGRRTVDTADRGRKEKLMCYRTLSWYVCLLAPLTPLALGADLTVASGEQRVGLSLSVLSNRVSHAQAKNEPLPEECRTLAGIGWIEGFVVDEGSGPDVILVGRRSPLRPSLRLDDLAISLRCAGQGQHPYCSLDPRAENIRTLQNLLQRSPPKSAADMKARFEAVKKAIGPQDVVVGGVPRNSRHGRVMIGADYHMKKVSQGLLSVPNVVSCPDRAIQEAKARFDKTGTLPPGGARMSRFWFHIAAGDPKFTEESGIVWLDSCRVVVLTERQKATASGATYDVNEKDPQAAAFARELSEAFPNLTAQVPVYAELENLFRLYAVTVAIAQRGVLDKIGRDCDSYLAGYRLVEERRLRESLPGLANYKELSLPFQQGNQHGALTLFPMVCGGVSMTLDVRKESFSLDPETQLGGVRLAVLSQRPNRDALAWAIRPALVAVNPKPKPMEPADERSLEILRKNSTQGVTFFGVNSRSGGATVLFPNAVAELSPDDLTRLQAGKRLEDSHAFSRTLAQSGRMLVLYTPGGKSPEEIAAADEVVFALQRVYREKQFGQSSLTERTQETAESFGTMRLGGLRDFVTVIAGDSFGVQDYNLKGNLPGALKQAKLNVDVRVVEEDSREYTGDRRKQVIVISGHIDQNLIACLHSLGEKGYFRENHVLLNTCSDAATRAAATKMIKQFGALTVFRYDRPIKAWEVQKFLLDLFQSSKEGTKKAFIDVMRELLERNKLNGIWDFCRFDSRELHGPKFQLVKLSRGAVGRDVG